MFSDIVSFTSFCSAKDKHVGLDDPCGSLSTQNIV